MDCAHRVTHCTPCAMDGPGNAISRPLAHCQACFDQSTCGPHGYIGSDRTRDNPLTGRAAMTRSANRRSFIKTVILGAGAASLGRLYPALAAAGSPAAPQKLGDNLWLLVSGGANVVACRDPAGVALVDGGPQTGSRDLLKQVSQATGAGKI